MDALQITHLIIDGVGLGVRGASAVFEDVRTYALPFLDPVGKLPDVIHKIGNKVRRGKVQRAVELGVEWSKALDDVVDKVSPEADEAMPDEVRDAFGVVLVWASCKIAKVPYRSGAVGGKPARDLAPADKDNPERDDKTASTLDLVSGRTDGILSTLNPAGRPGGAQ